MKRIIFFLAVTSVLTGCIKAPTVYFHPNANLAYVKKVAVFPFENNTKEKAASEVVRDVFVTELLTSGLFDVVSKGETLRALREREVDLEEGIGAEESKRLGKRLGVQGIIIGVVNEYGMGGQNLPYPEVSISAQMIELPSGIVVWKASATATGATIPYRLLGLGGKSIVEVAKSAANTLVGTLK